MKIIYLLRHAKSSWDDAALADFERPLNHRGESAAPFMGEVMADRGYIPEVMISSPAKRAASTARLVSESAGFTREIRFDDRIYDASPNTLRKVAADLDDSVASVMLVGHNPGMEGFIEYLTGELESMPTAALAVIEVSVEKWSELDTNCGKLVEIIKPKEEQKSRNA